MESTRDQSTVQSSFTDEEVLVNSQVHDLTQVPPAFPVILPTKITVPLQWGHFHIDHFCTRLSPDDLRPRVFRAGTLFDSNTYQGILASVYGQSDICSKYSNAEEEEEEEEDEEEETSDDLNNLPPKALFDEEFFITHQAQEIQHLNQVIRDNQPTNDNLADIVMLQLNDILEVTMNNAEANYNELETSSTTSTINSYPPIHRTGPIADHDRPYADYGHLNASTIAKECNFDLTCAQPNNTKSTCGPIRMTAKSWAITSWTSVSKEQVMEEIKRQFGIEKLQYACVAQETGEQNEAPHLHIQIILKEKANKKTWFLDQVTNTHCNYQVTLNDRAWNEYIKKGLDYIEFGSFKSTTARALKNWPAESSSSSLSTVSYFSSSSAQTHLAVPTTVTTATATSTRRRLHTAERRQIDIQAARQALELAKTSVHEAMDFILKSMPDKFLAHSSWYLSTFNYVHLRTQHEANLMGNIDKEYVWPSAFPNCTAHLREAVDRWLRHHFCRGKRAKCLILIGSTGIGKTSFALSLPGHANYFKERWNLDKWSDYARYSVYDDVPWDDFGKLNYPNKKGLLTQNGKMNATDKYRGTTEINVRQPAIVLLNPEDAGSLLTEPTTAEECRTAAYWQQRAYIYVMGSDEHFYKKRKPTTSAADAQTSDNSSMGSNEGRIGEPDEFDRMNQHYQQKCGKVS